jgi:RHS repeat-associated protein
VVRDDEVYYVESDHLGTPRAVIDPYRNLAIWSWDFIDNPFGEVAANEDPDGDAQLFMFNLRYPGQYFDQETGLHYNYFRDYEPGTGRYLESDPIGLKGDISTYRYVADSPIKYNDPQGLSPCLGTKGTVVCDGNNGFEVRNCNYDGCTRTCTQIHELRHQNDYLFYYPNACRGRPRNSAPVTTKVQLQWMECNASLDSIACADELISGARECTTPDCSEEAKNYKQIHVDAMRKNRCAQWGF